MIALLFLIKKNHGVFVVHFFWADKDSTDFQLKIKENHGDTA